MRRTEDVVHVTNHYIRRQKPAGDLLADIPERPNDAATRYNYAVALSRAHHYEEAQRELETALDADPKFADAHELLGDLLMTEGQAQAAPAHNRKAQMLRQLRKEP